MQNLCSEQYHWPLTSNHNFTFCPIESVLCTVLEPLICILTQAQNICSDRSLKWLLSLFQKSSITISSSGCNKWSSSGEFTILWRVEEVYRTLSRVFCYACKFAMYYDYDSAVVMTVFSLRPVNILQERRDEKNEGNINNFKYYLGSRKFSFTHILTFFSFYSTVLPLLRTCISYWNIAFGSNRIYSDYYYCLLTEFALLFCILAFLLSIHFSWVVVLRSWLRVHHHRRGTLEYLNGKHCTINPSRTL